MSKIYNLRQNVMPKTDRRNVADPSGSKRKTTGKSSSSATSALSPTRLSRLQEKFELQNLNDRLAAYIDRVRFLETENSRLSGQVQTSQETVTREVTNIKSIYERELSETRKLLDDTARDKARLQIELSKGHSDLEELAAKLQKKDENLTSLEKELLQSESHVADLQGNVNQLHADKKHIEDCLKEAEGECCKVSEQLAIVRKQLEEEAVHKVDLLNKLQSVKEELSFKETIHEQEFSESRILKQSEISDIDLNVKEQYDKKLADSLKEIREQYEMQLKLNKNEIESLYEFKLAELQKTCNRYISGTEKASSEIKSFRIKTESMTTKIIELDAQNKALKACIKDLEGLLQQEREWHQIAIVGKDDEIKNLRKDVDDQLKEYRELLDIKIALDMEIASYRKLLESEESRLNISIGEVQRSTPRRTPIRGKRRRCDVQFGEISTDIQSSTSAKGDIEISDHDSEGKFVKIFNKGNTDVSLGGWQVVRKAEDQETLYKFHRTLTIKAKSYVFVWSSNSGVTHSPPSDIVMKGQIWFTADNMSTILLNNNGEEVAIRETFKKVRSEEGSTLHISEELYHQHGDPANEKERCSIM